MEESVLANNIREKFFELKNDLVSVGVEMYFKELFKVMESDNDSDIIVLNKFLSNRQLTFLMDFDYQFYNLITSV